MDDNIAAALKEIFTPEELAEMRRQVQFGKASFVLCAEITRGKPDADGNQDRRLPDLP